MDQAHATSSIRIQSTEDGARAPVKGVLGMIVVEGLKPALIGVGVLATLLPAYRATRVDPIVTLRSE